MFIAKLAKTCHFFTKTSSAASSFLLESDKLMKLGHYKEALKLSTNARDAKDATNYEIKLAKGKIIEILGLLKLEDTPETNSCLKHKKT